MFLQKLELQGFKSFANKTVLDFPGGIAAVVGPNGSGKSNIADAIRWLLGEREARNLRGGKNDDLIFAGTEKKARMGMATASLYFDNSSGFFPTEFKEVVISRRIDRDGDSKFFLNQSEMRMKDIVDFFAKAKLGARGLNMIGQGESDLILKSTPLERRELIEELLGLKEYLLKKNAASRELKNTFFNLEKARAQLAEIEPHLRSLRRQVSRWTKRDSLAEELRNIENSYYSGRVRKITESLRAFDPEIEKLDKEIDRLKNEEKALEQEFKKIEVSEPKAKKELEALRNKRRELFNKRLVSSAVPAERSKASIPAENDFKSLLKEIRELAEAALSSGLEEDPKSVLKKIVSLIEDMENAAEAQPEVQVVDGKLEEFNRLMDELDEEEKKYQIELDSFNKVFRESLRQVEAKKDEIEELDDKKQQLIFQKDKALFQKSELENQLRSISRKFEDFVGVSADMRMDERTAETRMMRLRAELSSMGDVDEAIVKEAEATEERHEFLSNQIVDLEKASADLKTLLKDLDFKIRNEFNVALKKINDELQSFVKLMFGGGRAELKLEKIRETTREAIEAAGVLGEVIPNQEEAEEIRPGIEIDVVLPKKKIKGLEVLSGGERSLLSIAILFALISISPPPFLVLDEVDAALDERNARRFGELLKNYAKETQFVIVTHNRATMEAADVLYGVTMGDDGVSRVVSLKLS
ncbi:MAG TPA: AAA family ATPase [Candidatus Colwellbacteria bacterium]|nr:AAA family ATPase [Candidatus Colwellbacteria bacterium]